MTRFLEQALAGAADSVNQETERLFAYHHATKHTYYSVRASGHFLDWRNQPDPFRVYRGARLVPLAPRPDFPLVGTFETMAALKSKSRVLQAPAVRLDAMWLSRLLWHSMAVSAWKQVPQTNIRYSLRVNPSSGNLHPTETHLALCGFEGLEDGLYHYRADIHMLEQRGRGNWVGMLANALELDIARSAPLIVALTSVFWREAWKYRDRAYRYCCHDLGHALMSLLLAARALGLTEGVVAHFSDLLLARTLGLAQSDEAPLAFLVFNSYPSHAVGNAGADQPAELLPCIPNELSEEEIPYYLLLGMHRSTVLPEPPGPLPELALQEHAKAEPESRPASDAPLGVVARKRRSALDFDPRTPPMDRAVFEQLLDYATRDWPADWRGSFGSSGVLPVRGRDFIELYIYAHRIRELAPGVYRWSPVERRLEQLHGYDREGTGQRAAAYLSLEQPLAGHACFAISMIADLEAAAQLYGNRGYRYVHFEAGTIGQRLYLGAEALEWNTTGIGAFYDDDVHRYLGLMEEGATAVAGSAFLAEQSALVTLGMQASEQAATGVTLSESREEQRARPTAPAPIGLLETPSDGRRLPRQVIYHFAVGRAVPDPRLAAPET